MNFVQRNLPDKFSLDAKNLNRIDLRNLIFREIVANLLIHREFSSFYEAKFLIFFFKTTLYQFMMWISLFSR